MIHALMFITFFRKRTKADGALFYHKVFVHFEALPGNLLPERTLYDPAFQWMPWSLMMGYPPVRAG
jgi:hypothetical protein